MPNDLHSGTRTARRLAVLAALASVLMGCSAVPNLDRGGMGCANAGDGQVRTDSPTDPGQPLAGVDVIGRAPADVGHETEAMGLIVRYNLQYMTGTDTGYGECWCTPPTEGRVTEVFWGSNGQLIVMAETDPEPGDRDQPLFGRGCGGMFG
jgi:hypothetical protein